MFKNVRIAWIAAAMVVASPAFAGWPADQPAQLDLIGGQRIIREIVVDGHLTETGSDDAPANELRPLPNWLDDMFFTIFWTTYVPVAIVILSLVGDWLRHSFQEVRTPAWLICRIGGGSSEGQRQNWACRCER